MTANVLTKTAILAAAPETVWQFLTDKDKLATWFHPADANLSTGNDFALLDAKREPLCWGKVISMDPPSELVYTFTVKPLQGVMTTVTWQLEPLDDGTRVTLIHEGLDTANAVPFGLIQALDAGWDEHLAALRKAQA